MNYIILNQPTQQVIYPLQPLYLLQVQPQFVNTQPFVLQMNPSTILLPANNLHLQQQNFPQQVNQLSYSKKVVVEQLVSYEDFKQKNHQCENSLEKSQQLSRVNNFDTKISFDEQVTKKDADLQSENYNNIKEEQNDLFSNYNNKLEIQSFTDQGLQFPNQTQTAPLTPELQDSQPSNQDQLANQSKGYPDKKELLNQESAILQNIQQRLITDVAAEIDSILNYQARRIRQKKKKAIQKAIKQKKQTVHTKESYTNKRGELIKKSLIFSKQNGKMIFQSSKLKRRYKVHEEYRVLEQEFQQNSNWSNQKIEELAAKLNLSRNQVYKWNWDKKTQLMKKYESITNNQSYNSFPIFRVTKLIKDPVDNQMKEVDISQAKKQRKVIFKVISCRKQQSL